MARGSFWLGAMVVALLTLSGGNAQAMTLEQMNLVDLLRDSTSIVTGQVTTITDGVDANGVPYTEVTVAIGETLRGEEQGTYTFRQFGLREPRLSADGTRKLMPAPEGFPRYTEGENVMLFLYRPASMTGLRTTTGLLQGKFDLSAGRAENGLANAGLFRSISLDDGLASDLDQRMLDTEIGAVSSDTFVSFVRRAVQNSWIESCRMWDSDEGKTCAGSGKRPTRPTPRTTINTGSTPKGSQIFGLK